MHTELHDRVRELLKECGIEPDLELRQLEGVRNTVDLWITLPGDLPQMFITVTHGHPSSRIGVDSYLFEEVPLDRILGFIESVVKDRVLLQQNRGITGQRLELQIPVDDLVFRDGRSLRSHDMTSWESRLAKRPV